MTALHITPDFITRHAPRYCVTELEARLLSKDAKKARKQEQLTYKSLLRFAEWKAIAVLPILTGFTEKSVRKEIEYLTYLALEQDTPDRWRIPMLSIIDGVGKPFASAILSAVYPERFALMDARAVGVLFDAGLLESRITARVPYEKYLSVVQALAAEAEVSLNEVYRALYAYAAFGELSAEEEAEAQKAAAEAEDAAEAEGEKTAAAAVEDAETKPAKKSGRKTAKKSEKKPDKEKNPAKKGGKKSASKKSTQPKK